MKIQYLEVVTPEIGRTCAALAAVHGVRFGQADAALGGARTAALSGGGLIGVRAPMHESETPLVRPYWLVADIDATVAQLQSGGAEIAHPPMEIPGQGTFAIYVSGGVQHGLWQL